MTRLQQTKAWPIAAVAAVALFVAGTFTGPALAQEGSTELKAEYDEIIGQEAEMLAQLDKATKAREAAGAELGEVSAQTRAKQFQLLESQQALDAAQETVTKRQAALTRAKAKVAKARERLRKQIVAAYVAGGDGSQLEAFMKASSGEQVGQALAYGRAISGNTESLVQDLEKAEDEQAAAASAAARAADKAKGLRDDIDGAARLLVAARAQQQAVVTELSVQLLAEADALREVQGRRALVEGRVNSLKVASNGAAVLLADLQRDQPDWEPGIYEVTTPLPGVEVSSHFGMRSHPILGITRLHAGADMGAGTGTEIHAPANGVVVLAEVRGGYGNTIVIDHGYSLGTLYAHTSRMLVKPGDKVLRGQVIGWVGSTGLSTGPHLHFETRIKGMPVDPEGIIDFEQPVDYEALLKLYEEFLK